jgi:hypothetical protein
VRTLVTTGLAVVASEITTSAYVDFQEIVRATINEIGYNRRKCGFDGETCAVLSSIHSQSPDIAMGVDTGGAGDRPHVRLRVHETEELMPLPIMLAHKSPGACPARGVTAYPVSPARRQVTGHRRPTAIVPSGSTRSSSPASTARWSPRRR